MMTATCLDQRKPSPVTETHGMWRLTIRVPLPGRRDFYIGAATGRYWVPALDRWGFSTPRLRVCLPVVHSISRRPKVTLTRWCAHVNVAYDDQAA